MCALKVISKKEVQEEEQVKKAFLERNVLASLKNPFIIKLLGSFQTEHYLYFVLDFCPAGELFFHLSQKKSFSEDEARIIIAQVILAIEYLH